MLHSCSKRPSLDILITFLGSTFENLEDDEVKFKQWKKEEKNNTFVLSIQMTTEEFIEEVCKQVEALREHHFIAKAKAKFLRDLKNDLKQDEVIILLDFAENYSFIVQDAVQGYHWNNSQATLHPIVIYYLADNTLSVKKIFALSQIT